MDKEFMQLFIKMKEVNIAPADKRYKVNIGGLYLFFLLILIPHTSVAQKTGREGYVVTNTGDTIKGMFSTSRWDASPKQVSFDGPNGKEVYKPLDIKSFYVAGEFYESAIVDVDRSTGNLQNMDYSSQPEFIRDTLFVQVIFRGSKSLYYSKNAKGWRYFFVKDGIGPLEQLVYKKYLIDKQMGETLKTYVIENNFYIRQLKVLFNQCPTLVATVESAKYEMNNLENLFKKYAKCSGEAVEEVEKIKRLHIDFQATVGFNHSYLKFYSEQPAFRAFTDGDLQSKLSPDIGLGVSFSSLRRDRLSVNLFLLYTNLKVNGSHYSAIDKKESNWDFQYNCFRGNLNLGIRPIRSFPLYLTIGGIVGILGETHSEWVEIYPSPPPREREFASRDFQSGFTSSIGYQFKRINLEVMYERASGISNFSYLGSQISRFHFLVKYNIFSKEE
jgi:hypothetical protein